MQKLQLPDYPFRIREKEGKTLIFDKFRHRWVSLTPEEWVRQHFLMFLVAEKQFPETLIAVEKKVLINGLSQRFDLLVYDRKGKPLLVGEFKAPGVPVTKMAFDQALRYNEVLMAPFFLVSNGLNHYLCRIDFEKHHTVYLKDIPLFGELTG